MSFPVLDKERGGGSAEGVGRKEKSDAPLYMSGRYPEMKLSFDLIRLGLRV